MYLGIVGDWLYTKITGNVIADPRVVSFIDAAEWISFWLLVTVALISLFGLVAIYMERKVSAHMQSRLGPMRVGPKGLLQTLADGVKLLEKEDLTPTAADPVLFVAAPCFVFASAVAMFVVLPFAPVAGNLSTPVASLGASEVAFTAAAEDETPLSVDAALGTEKLTEIERRYRRNAYLNGEEIRGIEAGNAAVGGDYGSLENAWAAHLEGDVAASELLTNVTIRAAIDRPWYGTPAYVGAGLFFLLAISSLSTIGVVLAGWGSNNKWSLYGAIREAAQMVSYEIPMGIGALCVVVACSSLNLMDIAQSQETGTLFGLMSDSYLGILSWNIVKYPVLFFVCIMWYIGVLAHTKRAPFDLPEAESELIAGFMTEYSGMRWSLFFLAEYGEMYAMSALTVVLFLGGFSTGIPVVDGMLQAISPFVWGVVGAVMLLLKSVFLVFVMMWLRWTLPRIRLDQVMYLCLKCLLPFTMVALLVQTVWTLNPLVGAVLMVAGLAAMVAVSKIDKKPEASPQLEAA